LQSFKYSTYDIDGGRDRNNIQLVTSKVQVCDFMKEFVENTRYYVQYVHVDRLKDEHFRICRDTFPVGIVLSMVYFSENYTLQLQNEIES
jgi:hypothetical protein